MILVSDGRFGLIDWGNIEFLTAPFSPSAARITGSGGPSIFNNILGAGSWVIGNIFPTRTVQPSDIPSTGISGYLPFIVIAVAGGGLILLIASTLMGKNT